MLKKVRDQLGRRDAGDINTSSPASIDQDLDEAISVLLGEGGTLPEQVGVWIKSILSDPPISFQDPEAKDWLRRDDVRTLLKDATLDLITGQPLDLRVAEAKRLYGVSAGESEWLGEPLFLYAVSFLGLSLKAKAGPDTRLLLAADNRRARQTSDQLDDIKAHIGSITAPNRGAGSAGPWSDVEFGADRGLAAALTGQTLGPGDVAACPRLVEADTLLGQLRQSGIARLAGIAGGGKSICLLQTARSLVANGWRVVRLDDPAAPSLALEESDRPTLHLIDDAHLMGLAQLRRLEESTSATRWLLSAHTTGDGKAMLPGTLHLDARRAVDTIAAGLTSDFERTYAAVRSLDDRIGKRMLDERLEDRLAAAAKATYPWQFCFILSGGWRRTKAMADSARAGGADILLAALAARQIAMRDAPCSPEDALALLGGIRSPDEIGKATSWLVGQRLLLSAADLRCPHQRFGSVLIHDVLHGQDAEGRAAVAAVLKRLLGDAEVPLAGIAALLRELRHGRQPLGWVHLIKPQWLDPALARCWSATDANDVRDSAFMLFEFHGYRSDDLDLYRANASIITRWVGEAPAGACYALGSLVNHIFNSDEALGAAIRDGIAPGRIAAEVGPSDHRRACDLLTLTRYIRGSWCKTWRTAFMMGLDRDAARLLVERWPGNLALSYAASFCCELINLDETFGLDLTEALLPAISDTIRGDPVESFHELDNIISRGLRTLDVLGVYVGKLAPDRRRKAIARQYAAVFALCPLGEIISASPKRDYQSCAMLLTFLHDYAPSAFAAAVGSIDWDRIERAVGEDWAIGSGDAEVLFGVAFAEKAARPAIEAVIARNIAQMPVLPSRIALMFPSLAIAQLEAGREVGFGSHWDWSAIVVSHCAAVRPEFLDRLLAPRIADFAAGLSQRHAGHFNEALLLVLVIADAAPPLFDALLAQIDVAKAEEGWVQALRGIEDQGERGARAEARQVVAFLIEKALARTDACGELARRLRRRFPVASLPSADTLAQQGPYKPIEY